jgi:hypothetical protein
MNGPCLRKPQRASGQTAQFFHRKNGIGFIQLAEPIFVFLAEVFEVRDAGAAFETDFALCRKRIAAQLFKFFSGIRFIIHA